MYRFLCVGLLSVFALCACDQLGGKKVPDLKSDEQKASYAIGQQIGNGLKAQGLKIEVDALALAISDVLAGKESRITPQELQASVGKMQASVAAKQEQEAQGNLEAGKKYLEENKKKEGVKVTESGLQYEVLTAGKGASPKAEDKVKVHYKGTLIDGTEFDSSYKRDRPAEFGVGQVIPGWTEALQMMKVGSKWKLTIPSDLAYGPRGRPSIPGNSVLVFEVELLEIPKK